MSISPYATGKRRTRRGLFGFAVCEIQVEEPERSYWRRANATEWEWCGRSGDIASTINVSIVADTSDFTAKVERAKAALEDLVALAEKAGSLGIVVEVDDGEDDVVDDAAITRLEAVLSAHRRDPSLFR